MPPKKRISTLQTPTLQTPTLQTPIQVDNSSKFLDNVKTKFFKNKMLFITIFLYGYRYKDCVKFY